MLRRYSTTVVPLVGGYPQWSSVVPLGGGLVGAVWGAQSSQWRNGLPCPLTTSAWAAVGWWCWPVAYMSAAGAMVVAMARSVSTKVPRDPLYERGD